MDPNSRNVRTDPPKVSTATSRNHEEELLIGRACTCCGSGDGGRLAKTRCPRDSKRALKGVYE